MVYRLGRGSSVVSRGLLLFRLFSRGSRSRGLEVGRCCTRRRGRGRDRLGGVTFGVLFSTRGFSCCSGQAVAGTRKCFE